MNEGQRSVRFTHQTKSNCTTSASRDEPRRVLRIIQHSGKHCSCHLQGEYVIGGRFRKPYMGQRVGGELDLMVLIGAAEERTAPSNPTHALLPALYQAP
jgi:hypothetical protein